MQTYIRHTLTALYILKGTFLSDDLKNMRNSPAGLCSYEAPAEVLAALSNLTHPPPPKFSLLSGGLDSGEKLAAFRGSLAQLSLLPAFLCGQDVPSCAPFRRAVGRCGSKWDSFSVSDIGGCLGAGLGAGGQSTASGQP